MLLDSSNLNEETLKSRIKAEFFKDKKFLYSGDKIDFMLSYKHPNAILPILWGEAKRGNFDDLDKAFTQLLLTIGKHRLYNHHTPPYLCAFDAFRMEFIAFDDAITSFFYESGIDFSITPSNHNTEGFKHALDKFKAKCKSHKFVFNFKTQSQECKEFIENNLNSSHLLNKIQIDKNNFFTIYQKWFEAVKPTIDIDWEVAKTKGILDADYYLADLLSDGDKTIIEKLQTILSSNYYKLKRGVNELGKIDFMEIGFKDGQQAHKEFWNIEKYLCNGGVYNTNASSFFAGEPNTPYFQQMNTDGSTVPFNPVNNVSGIYKWLLLPSYIQDSILQDSSNIYQCFMSMAQEGLTSIGLLSMNNALNPTNVSQNNQSFTEQFYQQFQPDNKPSIGPTQTIGTTTKYGTLNYIKMNLNNYCADNVGSDSGVNIMSYPSNNYGNTPQNTPSAVYLRYTQQHVYNYDQKGRTNSSFSAPASIYCSLSIRVG